MPPPIIAIEVRRAMVILRACARLTRRALARSDVLRLFLFTIGGRCALASASQRNRESGTNYCAAASFSGSLTASKVANSMAQGSPFTFSTLRI